MKSQGFLILILLLTSCTNSTRQSAIPAVPEPTKEELRVIIPSEFKYIAGVDGYAAKYNLRKLRETTLPNDDLEVRIHVGRGPMSDLLVITRTSGNWEAKHFPWAVCDSGVNLSEPTANDYDLPPPRSGWATAWENLKAAGLLSLSGVKDAGWTDGVDYIVETNLNKTYLLYEFTNPKQLKHGEGQQMVAITDVVAEEFGLKAFRSDFSCDSAEN